MVASLVVLGSLAALVSAGPLSLYSPALGPMDIFKRVSSGCGTSGAESCSNSDDGTCCFEAPGGLLLQTQFWDTNPSTGPSDSWTIHGLWPDNCDGTFESSCDSSRAYTGIGDLLTAQGASDTLDFMKQYWVDINGQNEQFWEHEWSKHGTCYSTLETSCLPSGSPKGAEAVAFFQQVVTLFKSLPTYEWLANAGITPDSSKTFTLSEITSALKKAAGVTPALDCDGKSLNQISWYFHLKGSLLDGKFVPIDAPKAGSCASSGLKYPPKSGSSSSGGSSGGSTTTTSSGSSSTGTPGTLPTKATLHASTGGLLSAGTWSTQTLATYTLSGTTSSFTLKTSKGSCGVSSAGQFACGSGVAATSFSAVKGGGSGGLVLASGGETAWSSDGTPSGTVQEKVFVGSGHATALMISIVAA